MDSKYGFMVAIDPKTEDKELLQYDPALLSFVWQDMEIRHPMLSDGLTESVSPEVYGFNVWSTGGGCAAYGLNLPDGGYLLLTDEDGLCLPEQGDAVLGRYNANGECLALINLDHVPMEGEYVMNSSEIVADRIFHDVLDAMQNAEELGGPDAAEYITMMERIAAEAVKRATICRANNELECEE